jgi:hypothetical protein
MMTTATTVVVVLLATAGRYNNAGVPSPTMGRRSSWTAGALELVLVHHQHGRGVIAVASQQHPHHSIAITNSSSSSLREQIEVRMARSMEGRWRDVWTHTYKMYVKCRAFVESSMITAKSHRLWNESSSSLRTADDFLSIIRVGLVLCGSKEGKKNE